MLKYTDIIQTKVFIFFLFCLAFLYLLAGFDNGLNIYDEGLVVYGASRILQSDVPYKDFWTLYAPGQFYFVAGLFYVFGTELLTERISSTIIEFLLSVLLFWNASKLIPKNFALFAWALFVIWLGDYRFFANPMPSALILSFVGSLCLQSYFSSPNSNLRLLFAGVATGLAALFRHEVGLVTFLVESVVIILYFFYMNKVNKTRTLMKLIASVLRAVPYLIGFALIFIPCVVYFVVNVPFDELWHDLFVFPAKVYPKVRSLPFPSPIPNIIALFEGGLSPLEFVKSTLLRVHFYFPLIVYISAFLLFYRIVRKNQIDLQAKLFWGIVLFLSLGLSYYTQVFVRADLAHLLPTFFPASVLFGVLLYEVKREEKFSFWIYCIVCLMGVSIAIKPVFTKIQIFSEILARDSLFEFQIPRARGIKWDDKGAIYQRALMFVQNSVPTGRSIFVGNTFHDRIYINDIMFYFLANRHSATKYYELHPGLVTTIEIQSKIIEDIVSDEVEIIVLRKEDVREPNESGKSSGVKLLDEYIRNKYTPIIQFGDYFVLRRNL